MFEGQNKPNKNLWKSIKTQKTKYSGIDHAPHSPPYSYTKQSSLKSQPPVHSFNIAEQKKKQQRNLAQKLEKQFEQVSQEVQLQHEEAYHLQQPQNTHSRQSSNLAPVSLQYDKNMNKNAKFRRFSIGQESVVEQIVDFKLFNHFDRNLDIIADFQQQQQPMMMSLGSQSNHMIKQLKLSKMKDDIQKLQHIRLQFVKQLKQQSSKYQQFFKLTFHQLVSFIIEYYSNKCEQTQEQEIQKKDRVDISLQKQMSANSNSNRRIHSNTNTIAVPSNHSNNYHHSQQDTPTFVRHELKNRNSELEQVRSSLTIRNQLNDKIEEVQRLQQQIFKIKMQNQILQQKLHDIRQQNQHLNQSIFDYQQKIAQFQLQVNQKVTLKLEHELDSAKKLIKQQQLQEFQQYQKQRKQQYMNQILELEEQILRLEQKSKKQQYDEIRQIQLKQRQDKLKYRERQLKNRQIQLNQLQVQLNSQRMDLETKIQRIKMKQIQIKAEIDVIEQRQIEYSHKQKQMSKYYDRVQKSRQRQAQVYQKPIRYVHHRTSSGENVQAQFDFKLKHLSDLKTQIRTSKNRGGYRQQIQKHNASYALTEGNKNWKYPAFGINNNNNESNSIKKRDGDISSNNSRSGSKDKKKYFNKTYFNHNSQNNRTSNVILKSNISSISHVHSRNASNSGYKANDKNRLDDLGAKLENLRQQIRKEIRQTS